jgi:hypothetical protein
VYSHLNGFEFIMYHRANLWTEILEVIDAVEAESCKTKLSKEARSHGKVFYAPKALNDRFAKEFRSRGWYEKRHHYWVTDDAELIEKTIDLPEDEQRQQIKQAGRMPLRSRNQTDFVKYRIAVEVQFGKYAFVAYDLFVKHLAFYKKGTIDVGVEVIAMKQMQREMASGVGYYEGELYNLIREGRGVPAVPLVLIGVASEEPLERQPRGPVPDIDELDGDSHSI